MANGEQIKALVNNFIALLEERSANSPVSGRHRSPKDAVDIDGFFKLVGDVIALQEKNEGSKNLLAYMEDYPEEDDNIDREVITFCLVDRKPGTFEQKGFSAALADGNIRQRRKVFRDAQEDPDYPGNKLYSYGQWYDNIVEFKVYARTNKVANRRALWLEEALDIWEWFFAASGVSKFSYLGRDRDLVLSPGNRKVSCRTLRYYVRTERLTTVREQILRSLTIKGQNS